MPESNPARNNPNQVSARVAVMTEITGPIPPPQVLQQYNVIVPDAAERIIKMAEKQSDHRMILEKKVIGSNLVKSYLGMMSATLIAIYGLYISKEIAINGNPATAGIVAALDLGGLLSVAVYNIRAQRKERDKRAESSRTPPRPD